MHELLALFLGAKGSGRLTVFTDREKADDSEAFIQDWIRAGGVVLPGVLS